MEVVVKGRHTAVSERFRRHTETKLAKLERLDPKVYRVDAELSRERNPRLSGIRERVELTVYSRGPVIRAEAAAHDPYAALDAASAKLLERLRRAADRRGSHHGPAHHGISLNGNHAAGDHPDGGNHQNGNHQNGSHQNGGTRNGRRRGVELSVDSANGHPHTDPAAIVAAVGLAAVEASAADGRRGAELEPDGAGGYDVPDACPMVVREKMHHAEPMTLDDALSNMELVGHDFYLFLDRPTGLPSVVYRRCGYDYGVIRLGPASADDRVRSSGQAEFGGETDQAIPEAALLGARAPRSTRRVAAGRGAGNSA